LSFLTRATGFKNRYTKKNTVIPAKAGIQESQESNLVTQSPDPRLRGGDEFLLFSIHSTHSSGFF